MIVQELLKSIEKDELIKYYIDYCGYPKSTKNKKMVGDFYDQLINLEVKEDDSKIVFAVPSWDSNLMDSFIMDRKDLKNNKAEHYAYEASDPKEVLGYSISKACKHYIRYDVRYATAIFYELSFFGYSLEDQKVRSDSFIADIEKSVEEIKNGTAKLISADETFKKFGYKDRRTEEEKRFDLEEAKAVCHCTRVIIKQLCKLELSY